MTEIYLIRHCEAIGNVMNILQGSTDLDISPLGEKQLEVLAERFYDIKVDKVFSSPLIRTIKTARAVADKKNLEVVPFQKLTEIDGGIHEGKPFKKLMEENPDFANVWNNFPQDIEIEGGESMRATYERIWDAVLTLVKENVGKTLVAATHGGVLRCLHCRLLYGTIDMLKNVEWSLNTAVTLLRFDDEFNCEMVFYNDASHLPSTLIDERSKLSNFVKGE